MNASDYTQVRDCVSPDRVALLLLSSPVMYGQLLEEAALSPAARRECRCHKINVGAAREKMEITRSGTPESIVESYQSSTQYQKRETGINYRFNALGCLKKKA